MSRGRQRGPEAESESLARNEVHHVLSNERRRLVIELLGEAEEPLTAREVSERVAAAESGEDPPPRNTRHAVYVSLKQNHFPVLEEDGIVRFDGDDEAVELGRNAAEVSQYMADDQADDPEDRWPAFHLAASVVGITCVALAVLGVPVVAVLAPWHYGALFLAGIGASAAARVVGWDGADSG